MPIDNLVPASGAHSVQNAVFAIEWSVPLPLQEIAKLPGIYEASAALKLQFPMRPQPQNQLSIRVENGSATPASSHSELGGYSFIRQGTAHGPARVLQCVQESCLYIVNDYTRWKMVLSDAMSALGALRSVLVGSPITAIGLQYTDVFHWRGDPNALNLAEVLDANSDLFPASALRRTGLWHAHHGYLDSMDAVSTILDNINLDVVDNGGQRSLAITTSHRRSFTPPLYEKDFDSMVPATFELLHARNKGILKSLLTQEVSAKISLV